VEDDDGPGCEVFGYLVQIGEDDCRLLGCASPGQRRIRITDGVLAPDRASRPPKSVSAETRMRLVRRCLHPEIPQVGRVMSGRLQRVGQERRQVVVDEELHAVRRSGSSRSWSASAAYRRDSWMSAGVRSGCSARISSVVIPSATIATTVATGKRSPRMQGSPPMTAGSVVMRS
jgi:hypothetical protein